MTRAVCFDLDGVYFTAAGFDAFKQRLVTLGASMNEVNAQMHGPLMESFKKGEVNEDTFWHSALDELKLGLSIEQIKQLLVGNYSVNQEVKTLIAKLRASGYKTCICSNNFITRVHALQQKFGFLVDFDVAVFSYEVGVLKPAKGIFEELISRLAVTPNEIIYSDDGADKIKGALELGITAFVYTDFAQFTDELKRHGVISTGVSDLS